MTSGRRTSPGSLVLTLPGLRSNAPKRNTIVLLVYLVGLIMVLTGVRIVLVLDGSVGTPV